MATLSVFETIVFGWISGDQTISRLPSRCLSRIVTRFSVMRRAIVTGGQGLIERHLVKVLRRNAVDVRTLGGRQSVEPTHIVLRLFVDKSVPRIITSPCI